LTHLYLVGLTFTALCLASLASRRQHPAARHLLGYVAPLFYMFLRDFSHAAIPALYTPLAQLRALVFLGPYFLWSTVAALLGTPPRRRTTHIALAVVAALAAIDILAIQPGTWPGAFAAMEALSVAAPLLATLLAARLLWRFRKTQSDAYPTSSPAPIAWIAAFVAANLLFSLAFALDSLLVSRGAPVPGIGVGMAAAVIVLSQVVLHAARRGFRLFDDQTLASVHSIQTEAAAPAPRQAPGPDVQDLVARIDTLLRHEQLFINPDLGVTEVSDRLGETPGRITACIRAAAGESFKDFVNAYRVRHCMELLRSSSRTKNILNLAFDSGFNSKATFYRYFTKIAGCTPSEFVAKHGPAPQ
jgi:AraC-like DNA-binding protein